MTFDMRNSLDLIVQFSAANDLLFEATIEALDELAGTLEDDSKETDYRLLIPMKPAARSYEGFSESLHILKDEGLLKIYRDKSVLRISGSPENCSILAANLRFLLEEARLQPMMQSVLHAHIDYFPDHPYLDPISEPVVVYIKAL